MTKDTDSKSSYSQTKERSIIEEYLRSGECLIDKSSSDYDDFWRFYTLYRRKVEQSEGIERVADSLRSFSIKDGRRESEQATAIPSQYSIHWQCPLGVQRRVRDKRDARQQKWREQEQQQAESRVARHIIAAFLHFRQKTTFTKLKKLSDAQKNLPIYAFKEEILEKVDNHSVVIVAGDTGCGKSTQLPRYLLQHGYKSIVCTQPRRLACVSLCQRVAYETWQQYGDQIGYQIRFERRRSEATRVVFMTEGLLLRQVSADPMLSDYDVIVLDEVHERHLQGDFLLGVVKCLSLQRPKLRVILMSATINLHLFQDYFNGNAPIIQVPGRLFPIELVYRPISTLERTTRSSRLNPAPYVRILSLIDHKYGHEERGDLLIFLSGVKEIGLVADACQEYSVQNGRWIILPLHSSLAVAEQDKVFAVAPDGVRKCIISTNIAETSVTIDGVRFVVDSGRLKEMTYDSGSGMQRLREMWVSQASAEQRKGRAGRTGPGVCYRLYSQSEFELLAPFSKPEVQRVPLHSLVLQTAAMGLANVRKFPFIDRPEELALETAIQQLNKQGALTANERLTPLGHMLASLPVEVSVGAMLVTGAVLGQIGPALTVAAALSVQSPWSHRAHRSPECLVKVKELMSDQGDPATLLELFTTWLDLKVTRRTRSRRWCVDRGVEEQRLFEIVKLRRQFVTILEEAKLLPKPSRMTTSADRIRRHGEILQLRRAKRKAVQRTAEMRTKVLRVPSAADGVLDSISADAEESGDIGDDLGTLDMMMNADERELQELLNCSRLESFRDLTMLKIIICRGLYPNFAVPDLHNSYKANVDLVFHASSRPFVILHPNSSLAFSPDVLQVCDSDVVDDHRQVAFGSAPRPVRHSPIANTHQMLAFVTLLETTKPYVTNVLRVPTLQIMLLFSNRIDTSLNCTVLCCDQWLEFIIDSADSAQQLLARAISLRSTWLKLLQLHFNESESSEAFETDDVSAMRVQLVASLIEFIHTDVYYSYRRLLAADLQEIYQQTSDDKQEQQQQYEAAETVNTGEDRIRISSETCRVDGSTVQQQLPDYLHYNVLVSNDIISVDECICPYCNSTISCVPLHRLQHWIQCIFSSSTTAPPHQASSSSSGLQDDSIKSSDNTMSASSCEKSDAPSSLAADVTKSSGDFYCQHCRCYLSLGGIDILRHQRTHDSDTGTQ